MLNKVHSETKGSSILPLLLIQNPITVAAVLSRLSRNLSLDLPILATQSLHHLQGPPLRYQLEEPWRPPVEGTYERYTDEIPQLVPLGTKTNSYSFISSQFKGHNHRSGCSIDLMMNQNQSNLSMSCSIILWMNETLNVQPKWGQSSIFKQRSVTRGSQRPWFSAGKWWIAAFRLRVSCCPKWRSISDKMSRFHGEKSNDATFAK